MVREEAEDRARFAFWQPNIPTMPNLKSRNCFIRACTVCAALGSLLPAARADVGLTLKAGTLGLGVDLTFPLANEFNLRVGGNYLKYDYNSTYSNVSYAARLKFGSELTTVDWYPLTADPIHISCGGLINGNKIDLTGKVVGRGTYTINHTTYSAAEVGNLTADVSFNTAAPYFGIGWGNAVKKTGHWSYAFDFGAVYQGHPQLTYTTNGTLTGNPSFEYNLNAERSRTQSDLDVFNFYPVLSGGVSYRF